MSTRIYVGNLPYSSEEDEVRDLFEPFGEVQSIYMPTDRATGRPRGFAFVEMDDESAQEAMSSLDGQDHGGRNLRVNEARPRGSRGGGGGHRGGRW